MHGIFLIIIGYVAIGIILALWDFRYLAFHHDESEKNSTYLQPPKFIADFAISTALVFVLIWPYKLLRKL
jgi:hypothetical protein